MNDIIDLIKELSAKRRLVWDLSRADFRKRFVGSYFGVVWMFVQPVVTVLIYWLIFGPIGFKSAPPVPNASYVQWLIPGIAPWFFFSEAMNQGTGCLQEYNYLVKKVVFRVEILPVIKLFSCLAVHGFFGAICGLWCKRKNADGILVPAFVLCVCCLCVYAGAHIFYGRGSGVF